MKKQKRFSQYTLSKIHLFLTIFLLFILFSSRPVGAQTVKPMTVSKLGKNYSIPPSVKISQTNIDSSGTTSIRNISQEYLEWKEEGYFMRNRDLGQVFVTTNPINLESIVLRTGPTEKAVLSSTPGAKVFIQFFEVSGTPVINNNGTPVGTDATHGYTTNHRGDDFIEGVTYTSLTDIHEGTFPNIQPTYDNLRQIALGDEGKLHYMRWKFDSPVKLEGGKRYAFILGFSSPAEGLGFTVANANSAGSLAEPSLNDNAAYYKEGWGIRREGDGTVPPTMVAGKNPPSNSVTRAKLIAESLFATGSGRYTLQPTADGYPDVDTYRALEFYLEEAPLVANLIWNGEFDNGTNNWTVYNYPGSRGELQIETTQNMSGINAGKINIPAEAAGTAEWHMQLFQSISIEQGKQYNISFRGKAGRARALKIAIQENGQTGNENIYWSNVASLTTSDQIFTYSFTASTTNAKARFAFLCGGNSTDPVLDKIAVTIAPPTTTVRVSASSSENNINTPEKTRDNSLNTRWSSFGIGEWIQYDLGANKTVNGIEIAWFKGNERRSNFEVLVSINGTSWTPVLNRASSGTSLSLELYTFNSATARYVRVVCKGTSVGSWNSIAEAKIRIAGTSVSLRQDLGSMPTFNPHQGELVIFPNPLKGQLHLDLEAEQDSQAKISILTLSGTMLLSYDYRLQAGKNKINIDLNEIAEGLYIVSVDLKNKSIRRQFFLNK